VEEEEAEAGTREAEEGGSPQSWAVVAEGEEEDEEGGEEEG